MQQDVSDTAAGRRLHLLHTFRTLDFNSFAKIGDVQSVVRLRSNSGSP
jgi:hypothetical protein